MVDCTHLESAVRVEKIDPVWLQSSQPKQKRHSLRIRSETPARASSNRDGTKSSELEGWPCVECNRTASPWLCLTCGEVRCGRYVGAHGLHHYRKFPAHCVSINCLSTEVYCYVCDEYVGCDTGDGKVASVRSSLQFHNGARGIASFVGMDRESVGDEGTEEEEPGHVGQHPPPPLPPPPPVATPNRSATVKKRKITEVTPLESSPALKSLALSSTIDEKRWRGIRNIGNTCFMSAVLQALNSVEAFRLYMTSVPMLEAEDLELDANGSNLHLRYATRRATASRTSSSLPSTPHAVQHPLTPLFAEELRKMLIELNLTADVLGSGSHYITAVSPHALFESVWKISPRFRDFHQQDAHEFLRYILDQLHTDLRRCRLPEGADSRLSVWLGLPSSAPPPPPGSSLVTRLFGGAIQSDVTCLTCRTISTKQDPFLDLSLNIPVGPGRTSGVRLEDCLRQFFEKEELDVHEQYLCGRCRERRPSTKQLFLYQLPYLLCLHLKRFRWSAAQRSKLDVAVEFPLRDLDITSHVLRQSGSGRGSRASHTNSLYNLSAVVVHHGTSLFSGHYTAYMRRDENWYHCNDSCVRSVNESAVLKQKAYLLFYTRAPPP